MTRTMGFTAVIALLASVGSVLFMSGHPWWGGAVWLGALGLFMLAGFRGRRRAEAQPPFVMDDRLVQAQKLAALGELAAGLAHEINNPLAIIRQEAEYAQFMLKQSSFAAGSELTELKDSLREIISQVDRSREITRNLLDFARKRQPVLQKVQVNRLIEDMARLVEKEAKNKNISLVRQYDPDLPVLISDPPLLRQVVLNILNNALQAIDKDGQITIATAVLPHQEIKITVADSGPGIAPEVLPKIFDPFFTTKPQGQGTGLGLAICHGIIQKLGGRLSAANEPGQGARFTIILPLEADAPVQLAPHE